MRYRTIIYRAPSVKSTLISLLESHRNITHFFAPIAHALDNFIEEKLHHNLDRLEALAHPNEDFMRADSRRQIFVVADGVTLEFNPDGTYPLPSGAARAARAFSLAALTEAKREYKHFNTKQLHAMFRAGNQAVNRLNLSSARTHENINYWDHDLFATTAAFLVLKETRAHWASLCDSFVAHYDQNGTLLFRSPECWPSTPERRCFPSDWESRPDEERKKEIRRVYRNGLGPNGELIGYGVATGEEAAENYLNTGSFPVTEGDLVFLYTDGFEHYFDLPDFLDLFRRSPHAIKKELSQFSDEKAQENGALYAHDRTLIALKFDKV